MGQALGIVLREAAGFEVVFRESPGRSVEFDLDPEGWHEVEEYPRGFQAAGELGYGGRSGLYLFEYTLARHGNRYANFYKFFQPQGDAPEAWGSFLRFSELNITGRDHCANYDWCTGSSYVPPLCMDDPGSCPVLLSASADYDPGEFEMRIRNNNMKLVTAYIGLDWDVEGGEVMKHYEQGRDIVFYDWEPNEITASLPLVRLTFEPAGKSCPRGNQTPAGPAWCDYPEFPLHKFVAVTLPSRAPAALRVIGAFQVTKSELHAMMRENAGTHDAWGSSCNWLRSKRADWWADLVPPCIMTPADPPEPGDYFFDPTALQCALKLGPGSCGNGTLYLEALNRCVCAEGRFSGGGPCLPCPMGTAAGSPGRASCEACPPGRFAEAIGMSACAACTVGRYTEAWGSVACSSCGANRTVVESWTTMQRLQGSSEWVRSEGAAHQSDCGCTPGFRKQGEMCVRCGEGMSCGGMGAVEIQGGYSSGEVLSVFHCYGDQLRCPGGPLGSTCAAGRTGVSCAECEAGLVPGLQGACRPCARAETLWAAAFGVLAVAALCAAYYLFGVRGQTVQGHGALLCTIAGGQVITLVQQMAVLGAFAIPFVDPMATCFRYAKILAVDLDILQLDCIGTMSALVKFLMKLGMVAMCLLVLVFAHFAFVFVIRRGRVKDHLFLLANVVGTFLMAFYISVVSAVLGPLQCSKHPNSKWTAKAYQSVICWDTSRLSMHLTMVVVGILALLLPLSFLVLCVHAVARFPKMMRRSEGTFLKLYRFLFFRCRPETHWYVLVPMLRGLFTALAPVVPSAFVQIVLLQLMSILSLACTLHFAPWRVVVANGLDSMCTAAMLLLVSLSAFFVRNLGLAAVSWFMLTVLLLSMLVMCIAVGQKILQRLRMKRKPYEFFLCHHKAASGALARLLKMHLQDSPKVLQEVFIDSDNLSDLDSLFDYVGNFLDTLVVVGTRDIFLRPWCVGEMTTARLRNVKTVLVALPEYIEPHQSVIDRYEEFAPDLKCLTENGISVGMVRETLRWVVALPRMDLSAITPFVLDSTVEALVGGRAGDSQPASDEGTTPARVMILADHAHTEAMSTAYILQRLLAVAACDEAPRVIPSSHALPISVEKLAVLCTNRCFQCPVFLGALVRAQDIRVHLLPIVLEADFRFPGGHLDSTFQEHQFLVVDSRGQGCSAGFLSEVVSGVFKEIATMFQPHGSEVQLKFQAQHVARRIERARRLSLHQGDRGLSAYMGCANTKL